MAACLLLRDNPRAGSIESRPSCDRYRDIVRAFQNKFAELDRNFSKSKFSQQMLCHRVGQRFNQLVRSPLHELLRFLAKLGIVNRLRYVIAKIVGLKARPNRDAESEALRSCALAFRDTDARDDFKLLYMNSVVRFGLHSKSEHLLAFRLKR